jgi:hypothetical protein
MDMTPIDRYRREMTMVRRRVTGRLWTGNVPGSRFPARFRAVHHAEFAGCGSHHDEVCQREDR